MILKKLRSLNRILVFFTVTLMVLTLTGCGILYRQMYPTTGRVLSHYGTNELTPYLMSTNDIPMACSMGEATSNLLLSFERVLPRPNKTGLSSVFSAGLCSQLDAHEAELRRMRALNSNNPSEAQDAQIERDYHLQVTARRQYRAYKMFKSEYGEPGDECPEFTGRRDKFYYLLGLLAGVQAANNDFKSGRAVGVQTNVLPKTSRGSKCLDNREWWGIPKSLQAATWTIIPGSAPDDVDPWSTLDEATTIADSTGVRLAYAFKALAADNKGKTQLVKDTIRQAVKSRENNPAPDQYQLLDAMAFLQMRIISDQLWTKQNGHRTPPQKLGTFPDNSKQDQRDTDETENLLPGTT